MATAVVKAACDSETPNVELLRQRIIIQLLRESSWQPQFVAEFMKELIQLHVLTHEVSDEVHAAFVFPGSVASAKAEHCEAACNPSSDAVVSPCAAPSFPPQTRAPSPSHYCSSSSRFDREFERVELLGRGAFGEVWRARSRVDHREYAVKMVPYRFNQEEGPFEHPALREAQAWANFQHPNAVRYHAAWVEVDTEAQPHQVVGNDKMLAMQPGNAAEDGCPTDETTFMSAYFSADDSDSGVVFEASQGCSADQCSAPEAQAPQPAMQIVQRKAAAHMVGQGQQATLYVQTELVRGGTLREWIDKRNAACASGDMDETQQQLSNKAAEDIFRQVVDAVSDLHAQGMVHRDIKPANILLTESGGVRLADFGLVKQAGNASSAPSVADDAHAVNQSALDALASKAVQEPHTRGVGTPCYASPEQMHNLYYGTAVDMYALGMVLAELLVPVQTLMERAQLFEGLRAGTPPPEADRLCCGAAEVVLQMTSLDPEGRPSARELAALLHERASQDSFPMTCLGQPGCAPQEACMCESVLVATA